MSFGWAATGVAAITTVIGLWSNDRRGFAISLALTGSSVGGIVGPPVLVAAIDRFGFAATLLIGAATMAAVLVPMTVAWIGRPPWAPAPDAGSGTARTSRAHDRARRSGWTRARALRSLAFWTVTAPFALALLAQVGVLVHQIALLEPQMGRAAAGVAVAVTALAAVLGRLGLGAVVDRLDQRLVGAASFLLQAGALLVTARTDSGPLLLASCAVFGLSVGNVVTLPALIIQREFPADAFALLVGVSTAIGQFTYAFGPGLLGLLRDASGGYEAPLLLCAALEMVAAGIVLVRGPRRRAMKRDEPAETKRSSGNG
jgi:cyanate permease